MDLLEIAIAVAIGVFLVWIMLVATLYISGRRQAEPTQLREALRLLPDVIRLIRRLASDSQLPRGVRLRLGALLVYLALPIDLVPDFIPVVGYADDAIIVAATLRSVAKRAGPEALERHWPGTNEGLNAIKQLCGFPP